MEFRLEPQPGALARALPERRYRANIGMGSRHFKATGRVILLRGVQRHEKSRPNPGEKPTPPAPVTRHPSPVTRHPSPVTRHPSLVTPRPSPGGRSLVQAARSSCRERKVSMAGSLEQAMFMRIHVLGA